MTGRPRTRYWLILSLAVLLTGPAWAADPEYIPDVGPDTVFYPALSGDGQTMAWADGQNAPYLVLHNLDTNVQVVLDLPSTTGDTDLAFPNVVLPSLSDDGTRVAMMADGPSGSRDAEILLVVNDSGAELARVTALDSYNDVALFRDDVFISGDGRYVVFSVDGRTLKSETASGNDSLSVNNGVENVFRLDTQTGTLELVSINSSGKETNDDSFVHGVSDDGRYVLFSSNATDLPGATGELLAYRRDMSDSTVVQVSVDDNGVAISKLGYCGVYCRLISLSDDGARAVYTEDRRSAADGQAHTRVWTDGAGSVEVTTLTEYGANVISGDGLWLAPEGETFSRLKIADATTDPVAFLMESTRVSDDAGVLLFFNDTLTKPAGQSGNWWLLRYTTTPPVDTTPPSWPGGSLTATQVGLDGVALNWTAAIDGGSGVKEYVLYRDTSEIARQSLRTFNDGPLPFGSYDYRVEAVDIAGNPSTDGPVTSITLAPAPIELRLNEVSSINDTVAVVPGLLVNLSESISVSDQVNTLAGKLLQLSEQIQVMDTVTTFVTLPGDVIELLTNGPLFPGSEFLARASGFKPFSLVQAFLQSEPVLVGEETADAQGNISFTITVPVDFPPGIHYLILKGIDADDAPRELRKLIIIEQLEIIFNDGFESNVD